MVKENLLYDCDVKKFAVRGFIRDLLLNNIDNVKCIWNMRKALNIDFNPNTVMVVMIDNYYSKTYNKSEIQRRNLRLNVLHILEEVCSENAALTANIGEDIFVIVFESENYPEISIYQAKKLGNYLQNIIRKKANISVSIGIGRRYKEIQNLYLSFKEAMVASKYKFFLGENQVIHIDDINPYSENLQLFSSELESIIVSKVLNCDKTAVKKIIDDIFEDISLKSTNPVFLKTRFIEILNNIIRISLRTGVDQEKLATIDCDAFNKIINSDTMGDLKIQVTNLLINIISVIFKEKQGADLQVYQKAIEFIDKNYKKQISLEDVAKHVHISPSHFSRGFKEFTGINFIDYVTKKRIEEAKKLLLTTNLNIGEVGLMVGYDDPNYFGRVFKNMVGMPPSKFKVKSSLYNKS